MKLLDAVNLVLPKLGERPVTSLEIKHPTLSVLLPIFTRVRRELLARGWWFNEFDHTYYPGVDGTIMLGTDTLSFVPHCADVAVLRGLKLFNPVTLTDVFTAAVAGRLTQDVLHDDLPESVASYVGYSALVEAFTTDIGMSQELQVWQGLAGLAWSNVVAEHLRQKKHSTRRLRSWRRINYAIKGN